MLARLALQITHRYGDVGSAVEGNTQGIVVALDVLASREGHHGST